jgi:hypothetical protein
MGSGRSNPWTAALILLVKHEFSNTLGNNDYDYHHIINSLLFFGHEKKPV